MTQATEYPAWIEPFLAALAETGTMRQAAKRAGISTGTAHDRYERYPQFADAWDAIAGPGKRRRRHNARAKRAASRNTQWRTCFLEALAETSNVTASAARASVDARTVYKTRRDDAGFAAKWLAALREGYDNLEIELLGYLRDPAPGRKMDVTAALRLLAAHRETVERQRALMAEDDEDGLLDSLDRFIDDMCLRREANAAIPIDGGLIEAAPREAVNDNGAE